MNQRARQRLGSGYVSYIRLKLQGIANDVTDVVATAYAYPADSGQASFVRMVMLAAIADRFPAGQAEVTEALVGFLRTPARTARPRPTAAAGHGQVRAVRQARGAAGGRLAGRCPSWRRSGALRAVRRGTARRTGAPRGLTPAVRQRPRQPAGALLDRLGAHLDGTLKTFPGRLWERFVAVTDDWPELQQLLLVRFRPRN